MLTALMGPIPVPYTTATGTGDLWVGLLAILLFAIAVTVALVLANPPRKAMPTVKQMPTPRQMPTTTISRAA